jgi:tRNA threonylcarbamoyladenosine biosynthesis protein TsaB
MIKEVLSESKLELTDLDAIVLGNGPGSFIGMRIAASVSQGLAHGAGLDVIPVSSLSAVAAEVLDTSKENYIAVAQDAHMNEVYLGLYVRDKFNKPKPLVNEYLQEQGVIEFFASHNQNFLTAGQGWKSYPELARLNSKWICGQADISAAIKPQNIQPAYLRQKVAELPSNK